MTGMAAQYRRSARANLLANHRLHAAMAALSTAEFQAPRAGFFPSLAGTLNHILAVDILYLAALHGEANMLAQYEACPRFETLQALAETQRQADERLIRYTDGLTDAGCDEEVALDRGEFRVVDRVADVLAHLFMHQTHHRGQAHAMLSGTAIEPPQLDEFLLASDAPQRAVDLQVLGWNEGDLFDR